MGDGHFVIFININLLMTVTSDNNNQYLAISIVTRFVDVSGCIVDKERIKIPVSLYTRAGQSRGIFT